MNYKNRTTVKIVLIVSFILVNVFLLFGLSSVLEYLNSGADRSTMLHMEKVSVSTYLPKVVWEKAQNEGREMEPNSLKMVENDYLLSWFIKNHSLQTNSYGGIEDFYTKNPRTNLNNVLKINKSKNITIESTTLKHFPKLEFYSEDGQQIVITDKNVIEYQRIIKNNQVIAEIQDTATYRVMMLLEDGFWRVRHIKKMAAVPFVTDTTKANPDFKIEGKKIKYKNVNFTIKGINYYPKNSAWDTFGFLFNKDTIAKDFDIIKKAKLNTIRIFIQYEDFGKADIKKEKMEKLKTILDLAEAKKLKVIVTLFDFYSDYTVESWTLTQRHTEKLVTTFKNHKAILAWDIKNEPNLDFEARKKINVLSWLEQIIVVIRENDPNHLVTIGWSNSNEALNLENKVDFISYHYYNPIENFDNENGVLDTKTKKPIVIEEFGKPSYNGVWNWFESNESEQADYHKKMQEKFGLYQVNFLSWTLYDFPMVPDQVAGKWPWQTHRQKKFGFIDEKGKKKPAFKYINN
jgi:Cellulase (glycosyl hydrolase family 5)